METVENPGAIVNVQKSLLEETSHKCFVENLEGLPLLWATHSSPLDPIGGSPRPWIQHLCS